MLEERDDIVVCFFFHFANVLYYYCNIIFLRPIFLVNHRHKVLALSVKTQYLFAQSLSNTNIFSTCLTFHPKARAQVQLKGEGPLFLTPRIPFPCDFAHFSVTLTNLVPVQHKAHVTKSICIVLRRVNSRENLSIILLWWLLFCFDFASNNALKSTITRVSFNCISLASESLGDLDFGLSPGVSVSTLEASWNGQHIWGNSIWSL